MLSHIPGQSNGLSGAACALLRDEGAAAREVGCGRAPPYRDEQSRTEWLIGYDGVQPSTTESNPMSMTPEQKVKWLVLIRAANFVDRDLPEITADNIDEVYSEFEDGDDGDYIQDACAEVREGEEETGLPTEHSRYYEAKAVASMLPDGTWVGWTYWYGGGKHSEPESIDWVEHAYDLAVTEEEKVVTVRTFARPDQIVTRSN